MESRSKKSARNIIIGFITQISLMAFAFSTKTVFVRLLGVEYNGVHGLYSNILSILSLSELGIGNVLNYALYQALKEDNQEKVRSLVEYFKKIYYIIAFIVLGIGVALVPVLPYIVNSALPQDKLILYYLLYLLNSVASYFVVYKTTVMVANQDNYIKNIFDASFTFLMYIVQIIYILIFKDFLGYLIIQVTCTIIKNVVLNVIANKKYPYLRGNNMDTTIPIDKHQLSSNIKATFFYKIATVILNNTDNILISVIVGTVYVGYYSNYYMIVTYIAAFVNIFIAGITASLGNLNAEHDNEASYRMFSILSLVFSFVGVITTSVFINCMQDFISIWLGTQHVQNFSWVIAIVINNYYNILISPVWMFRETMGLFKQVKYLMLITAFLNLVFSIVLGILFGVPGILIATVLARVTSQFWYEPKLLFRYKFKRSSKLFFVNQVKQVFTCLAAVFVSYLFCRHVESSFLGIVVKAIISTTIALIFVWFANFRSEAWKMLYGRFIIPALCKIKIVKQNN